MFDRMISTRRLRTTAQAVMLIAPLAANQHGFAAPVEFGGNGNHYDFIDQILDYEVAKAAAAGLMFGGVSGHLATISSAAENDFLKTSFANTSNRYFAWLGGTDGAAEGVWRWDAGPDMGVQFSAGATPTAPANYVNWNVVEPNNGVPGDVPQNFAVYLLGTATNWSTGEWGDVRLDGSGVVKGYLVEYETGIIPVPPAFVLLLAPFGILASASLRRRSG